jgi:hypothetical protein
MSGFTHSLLVGNERAVIGKMPDMIDSLIKRGPLLHPADGKYNVDKLGVPFTAAECDIWTAGMTEMRKDARDSSASMDQSKESAAHRIGYLLGYNFARLFSSRG